MRYQSFYPFTRQQSSPHPFGLPGFGVPPSTGQPQFQRQPFQFGPTNQPYPGPIQGGPPAQGSSKMEAYMQTANRFLNTAQQFAPVVQQFAPMMQNLPAMWKLYKGFQSLPSTGSAATIARAAAAAPTSATAQSVARSINPGSSIPRIFQPPGF